MAEGVGMIAKLAELQRKVNHEMAQMTPEERAAAALAQLAYILEVNADAERENV